MNDWWRHHRGLSTPTIAAAFLLCWRRQQSKIHAQRKVPPQPTQGMVNSARCWRLPCKLRQKVGINPHNIRSTKSQPQLLPSLESPLHCSWLRSCENLTDNGLKVGKGSCVTCSMLTNGYQHIHKLLHSPLIQHQWLLIRLDIATLLTCHWSHSQ